MLEAAAGSDETSFGSVDVRARVRRAQRNRRIGAAVVALLCVLGAVRLVSSLPRHDAATVTAGETAGGVDLRGRWLFSALSQAVTTGSNVRPTITFTAGRLQGQSGCGTLDGDWRIKDGRLVVSDLGSSSGRCDASTSAIADVIKSVLLDDPMIGRFDADADSLKLTGESGTFVAFQRDVAEGTATAPERTAEVMKLKGRYNLVTEGNTAGPGRAPSQVRSQAWQDLDSVDVVRVSRQVGGVPFSAKALALLRPGAVTSDVRGHPGVLEATATSVSLTWEESPGITLRIDASPAVDPGAVARLLIYDSGKLLPSWGKLSNRPQDQFKVAASGEADGIPWQLQVYNSERGVCIDVAIAAGSAGGCGYPEDTVTASAYDLLDSRIVAGSASSDTALVRIEYEGIAEPSTISAVTLDGYQRRYFGGAVSSAAPIKRIVALDGSGAEMGVVADVGGGSVGNAVRP
jgi:hypothetical protein